MDDLLTSPAFLFLAEQVAGGVISAATAEAYTAKYAELYRAANNAVEREKDSLAKARDLRAAVREGRDNGGAVAPALATLAAEIADARGDAARAASQAETMVAARSHLAAQAAELEAQVAAARTTANALRAELVRVKGEPERAANAVDSLRKAVELVNGDVARVRATIAAREAEVAEQAAAAASVSGVKRDLDAKLARYRADIEAREGEVHAVERSLRSERTQYKDLLERRIDLQTEEAAATAAARAAEGERDATAAAYERAKRELKRKTDAGNEAAAGVPTLEALLTERQLEAARLAAEGKAADEALGAHKHEMDVELARFLKAEGVEKKYREQLAELAEACAGLEAEKEQWHKEELLCLKQLSALKAQRDIKSRDLAKLAASRKISVEHSKVKELQLLDLTKQLGDINTRLRSFAAMYEVVKNERNTFANSIQAASQSIAEMRERIKILHNEVDILQNESGAKDKALAKEQQAPAAAGEQGEALGAASNKHSEAYREKQKAVEGQIMAIDKLNSIINALEREMLALKKQYELAVETRNFAGIQLIDRNDELCILYEKSNIHEKTLGDGERELRTVGEEARALRIAIADVERQLHLARSKYPETPMWAERILELQKQLVQSRAVTEKLCADLETPGASDRWMELGGEDPDAEKLKLRVVELEARVNAAREELLEKDLILEELASLVERLQSAASAAAPGATGDGGGGGGGGAAAGGAGGTTRGAVPDTPGVALAKTANDLQSKIKDLNRKMMAVVSELSMYQATAIKLAAETTAAHDAVGKAETAMTEGRAPTLAADHKWQSLERQRLLPPGGGYVPLCVTYMLCRCLCAPPLLVHTPTHTHTPPTRARTGTPRWWRGPRRRRRRGQTRTSRRASAFPSRTANLRLSSHPTAAQTCGFTETRK